MRIASFATKPNFDLKKYDRRLKPETQLRILNDNEWKRLVRLAWNAAAEVADDLAQTQEENIQLRAQIRKLGGVEPPERLEYQN